MPNYNVFNYAVSNFDGDSVFHICKDIGASSLNEFVDDVEEVWRIDDGSVWGYRKKTKDREGVYRPLFTEEDVNVKVIRLDSFIEQYGITEINFLHIDAQGSDLKVMESLGEKINIVRGGVIEAASGAEKSLYKGQNTSEETVKYINDNGFTVTNIEQNDPLKCEVNISFISKKKGVVNVGR
jgi:FkbM family methyltransferase